MRSGKPASVLGVKSYYNSNNNIIIILFFIIIIYYYFIIIVWEKQGGCEQPGEVFLQREEPVWITQGWETGSGCSLCHGELKLGISALCKAAELCAELVLDLQTEVSV